MRLRSGRGGIKISKIYISGPITDTTDYMERFSNAQQYLESKGWTVINPALVNSMLPNDTTYDEYIDMSFCMLKMCDHIYMLKNFENSKGAMAEYAKAKELGLKVLFEMTINDIWPSFYKEVLNE